MIQYYLELKQQVKDIKELSLGEGQIQKIYSTAYFVSMAIRKPGRTWHIFLGRGNGYEGVWLSKSPPPALIRRKDNFLEYLRRHISSCSVVNFELDKQDRIFRINFRKYGDIHSFLIFWKARKTYFLHYYKEMPDQPYKLLLSWRGKAFLPDSPGIDLFDYFNEVGRSADINQDLPGIRAVKIEDLIIQEAKSISIKTEEVSSRFLERKKQKIEHDLIKNHQWKMMKDLLDKSESDLNEREIKIGDHKIKFSSELNYYERRNVIFQKIKKLKKGEAILRERLKSTEDQLKHNGTLKQSTKKIPMIRPVWEEVKNKTQILTETLERDYKVFKLQNVHIGVGLSARGNDSLRNNWASREDHWMHLDARTSAHVVMKLLQGQTLSIELLNLGANVVAHFSKFHGDWIPIIYTQVKNLKGVSGSAGMVTYKKEKHIQCPKQDFDNLLKE